MLAACRSGTDGARQQSPASRDTSLPAPTAGAQQSPVPNTIGRVLPRTGLAVADSNRVWCAEFVADSSASDLVPGLPVTIVFVNTATVPARRARVRGPRPGECPAAFPQPRWFDYVAYDLELPDTLPADTAEASGVGLVVASEAPWIRSADGVVRADLDGDGIPEEARRCTADEGEHFTLWSPRPAGGRVRRWHEYFDWGGLTEATCKPGEDGGEPSIVDAT